MELRLEATILKDKIQKSTKSLKTKLGSLMPFQVKFSKISPYLEKRLRATNLEDEIMKTKKFEDEKLVVYYAFKLSFQQA